MSEGRRTYTERRTDIRSTSNTHRTRTRSTERHIRHNFSYSIKHPGKGTPKRNSRIGNLVFKLRQYITVPSTILAVAAVCLIVIALNLTVSTKTDAHERDPHAGEYKYYKSIEIQSGDTLWSIAEEYAPEDMTTKEYVNHLKAINGLTGDNITSGCHIIVSYYSEELF